MHESVFIVPIAGIPIAPSYSVETLNTVRRSVEAVAAGMMAISFPIFFNGSSPNLMWSFISLL